MAAHDWSATPVGPVDAWPQALRSTVKLLLRSRYPMLLTWGEHYTQLYNDAYSQLIGDRHPAALGGDVRVTLAEGWDVLGPIIEAVLATRVPSWVPALQLLLVRSGYREEAYFDVSHAAVDGDDGVVAGMFCACSEVTERVVGERRLRLLRELSIRVAEPRTVPETCAHALQAVAEHPLDVPFACVYLPEGDGLRRVSCVGVDPAAAGLPEAIAPGDEDRWGLLRAARGETVELHDVEPAGVTGGPWGDPVHTALSLTVEAGEGGRAVLVAGVSPARALDDSHRAFFALLAAQLSAEVRSARAVEVERERHERIAALDGAKTLFFANVSHEFRTPLTLLLGPLEDALAGPLPDDQRERVTVAARNARRMARLVDELLDFARMDRGGRGPRLRRIDLADFTADVASVFRAAMERAGLRLVVDAPPLPRPVAVDPDLWERVVLNLVSNAFKHTFTGEVRVALRPAGEQVVLEVSDTGIGIPPEELPRVFERFHRVPDDRARTHEGTGIGLALVHDIAASHGGRVAVASEPGRGSRFTVAIPAGLEAAAAADVEPSRQGELSAEQALGWLDEGDELPAPAPDDDRPRVLVADDNADMRSYVVRLLRDAYRVEAVPDGEAALAAATADPPDLVLTDVMMPRLDGFALLRALRDDPATAGVPVVLLTARSGADAAAEGLRRGADDYVAKPFVAAELRARVHANLGRSARAAEADAPPEPGASEPSPAFRGTPAGGRLEVVREDDELRLSLPAEPRAVGWMRRELRAFLADLEVAHDVSDGLVLAASEAVTNALEHAQDPVEPRIDMSARLERSRLRIDVRDFGRWLPRGPSLDRGRGSLVMEAMADVQVVPSATGTLVSLLSREPA